MLQVEQRAARRAVRRLVLRTPVFVHRTVLACPMDPETGAVVGSPTWHAEVEYVAQLVSRTQLRSSLSRKQASHVTSVPGLDPTFHLISWHRQLVPIQGDATGIQLGWTTEGREVFPVLVEACERRHRAVTAIIFDALRVGPPSPEGSDSEDPGPTLSACHAANHIFGPGRELTYMGRH